jgi:uncharacterized protein YndB with AHSA1/START domain
MPVTEVISNAQDRTLTIVADYPVPLTRRWDAYADPRQLERFWGPVEWPATFTRHDMAVGGRSHYYMTGPDGTQHHGWFRYIDVEPYSHFEVEDGFSDANDAPYREVTSETMSGTPGPGTRNELTLVPTTGGTLLTSVITYPSKELRDMILGTGMTTGMEASYTRLEHELQAS